MGDKKCILNAMIVAVVLNLLIPRLFARFATDEEINHPDGVGNLSYKGQFMHMMVDHTEDTLLTSVFIAGIVGLSVYLGYVIDPIKMLK